MDTRREKLEALKKEKNAVIDEQKKTIMDQKAKIEEQDAMMEAMKNENAKRNLADTAEQVYRLWR